MFMANYQIENPHAVPGVDYIIEQGNNYRKWASGKLEAFGTKSVTMNEDVVMDLGLPSGLSFIGATSDVSIQLTPNRPGGYNHLVAYAKGMASNNRAINLRVYMTQGTYPPSNSCNVSYFVIGEWK